MTNYRKLEFGEVAWDFDDCTVRFTCICGADDIQVDGDGESEVCEVCGREYRMVTYVEVKESAKKGGMS